MFVLDLFADAADTPFWAGSAVVGAVIAALGYVGKLVADLLISLQRERRAQRAQLVELRSLLRASRATFLTQRKLAERLFSSLRESHKDLELTGGYEKVFSELYSKFTNDQKELHVIIRGMTEHSMRPLNTAMNEWLRKDTAFKAARHGDGLWGDLAHKLRDLEAHLVLWLAKYQAWFPNQENHALVYLEDEQAHGVGFPSDIDPLVEQLVEGRPKQA